MTTLEGKAFPSLLHLQKTIADITDEGTPKCKTIEELKSRAITKHTSQICRVAGCYRSCHRKGLCYMHNRIMLRGPEKARPGRKRRVTV
jgi:hypothetical protein